jgi:putative ABC transport system permease protein
VRVLGFTLGASILTGIIFGLVPALQSSVANLSPSARAAEKGGEGGRGGRLRGGLVSVQVALALVLLVAAGLLTRSFIRVNSGDIGFKAENVLTLRLLLSDARKYAKPAQWRTFQERAVEAVAAVPGVETVGTTTTLPLSGWWGTVAYQIVGRAPAPAGREPEADNRVADPGYFRAMGLRLIRGRFFDTSDRDSTERVVLINETLARKEWKEGDPVGSYLEILGGQAAERYRIAGVVNDVKHFGLDTDTHAEIYRPFAQQPSSLVSLTIKTRRDPMAVADPVRRAIWRVDAEQPVSYVMAMEQLTAEALAPRRVSTLFVSLFALVVLALSAIGTYGLLASVVSRRTREIGVRMALGADRGRVVRVVLGHALLFVGIGVGVGLVTAIGLVRLMQSVLFGVSATDPLTFVAVPAAIVLTALVSALVPAWRAASIDPAIALRYE